MRVGRHSIASRPLRCEFRAAPEPIKPGRRHIRAVRSDYVHAAIIAVRTRGVNTPAPPRNGRSKAVVAHFPEEHRKIILIYTFEAGISMKTRDHKRLCPNRNGHLGLSFRHFAQIEAYFAWISRLFVAFGGDERIPRCKKPGPPVPCP